MTSDVRIAGAPVPGYHAGCDLRSPRCLLQPNNPAKAWLIDALGFSGLNNSVMKFNSMEPSSSEILQSIRDGLADMTLPYYTPKTERLYNISVISAPVSYVRVGFLINRALLSQADGISWKAIFCIDVWIMILIWKCIEIAVPSLPKSPVSAKSLELFLALFGFYANLLFSKSILANRFHRTTLPFSTITEATDFVLQNSDAMTVFGNYPDPRVNLTKLEGRYRVIKTYKELFSVLKTNGKYFSINDFDYLQFMLGSKHKESLLLLNSAEPTSYSVSFCRTDYNYRKKLTCAYNHLNEVGLTYARSKEAKPPDRSAPMARPITMKHVITVATTWACCFIPCTLSALLEQLMSNVYRAWFSAPIRSLSIDEQTLDIL